VRRRIENLSLQEQELAWSVGRLTQTCLKRQHSDMRTNDTVDLLTLCPALSLAYQRCGDHDNDLSVVYVGLGSRVA
jgi:hypothetical protein